MKSEVRRTLLAALLSLSTSLLISLDCRASIVSPSSFSRAHSEKEKSLLTSPTDGQRLLSQVIESVKAKGAYKYDGYLATDRGKEKLSVYTGKFFYKPDGMLRVEVKSGGFKAGSVLVKNKNSIKAKGGPSMFGMRFSLKPDSPLLRLPNGINIVESDFLSLLSMLGKQSSQGLKLCAGETPILVNEQKVLVLETLESQSHVSQRVLISPDELIPIEWLIFKNGKFLSTVKFNNFQPNSALDDSLFHL